MPQGHTNNNWQSLNLNLDLFVSNVLVAEKMQKACLQTHTHTHTHTHNAQRPFWNVLLDNLIIFSVSPTTIASATFRNHGSFRLKIFNDILVSALDTIIKYLELHWWLRHKTNCLQCRRPRFNPWVGRKIPWRKA